MRPRSALAPAALALACAALAFSCGHAGDRAAPARQPATPAVAEAGAGLDIAVDRRVELISILCRLAGYPEYNKAPTNPYVEAIDAHFAAFRGHRAVRSTAGLKKQFGIGYNAPMGLAVYLDSSYRAIRPLAPLPEGMDSRWEGVPFDAYLEEVRDFAVASGFEEFFTAQHPYYARVEERYRAYLADKPIIPWFDAAFGQRQGASYELIPGLLVYPMAYSATAHRADGTDEIALVMFLEESDPEGVPHPGEQTLRITVHELAHSYVNPIFDPRMADMEAAAAPVYARVEQAMRAQTYAGFPLMVNESVVRAVTILYLREKSTPAHVERVIADEKDHSFLWIDELTAALAALREKQAGRLPAGDLVTTARDAFAGWTARQ